MNEATLQTQLLAFLRLHKPSRNFVCELKIVKQPKQMNFRYAQLRDHQQKPLINLQENCFAYKISDSLGFAGVGRFTAKKPLDFIYMEKPEVYIGIGFWKIREKKIVYFITPGLLAGLKGQKLTEDLISQWSDWAVDLKHKKLINYKYNGT